MDKDVLKKRIEKIINELTENNNVEIFGKIEIDILDIDDLALVKGNKIYFSYKVGKLSDNALRYVVAHELAHLKFKRHSEKFWEIVRNICPSYEKGLKELNQFLKQRLRDERG